MTFTYPAKVQVPQSPFMEQVTLSVIIMGFQVVEFCNLCWGMSSDWTRLASADSPVIIVEDAGEKNWRKRWVFLRIREEEEEEKKPATRLLATKTGKT